MNFPVCLKLSVYSFMCISVDVTVPVLFSERASVVVDEETPTFGQ